MNEKQSKLISSALKDFSDHSKAEIAANRPNFVNVAEEMYRSTVENIQNNGVLDTVFGGILIASKNITDLVEKYPVASSVLSVPVGVSTVLTSAFLFR